MGLLDTALNKIKQVKIKKQLNDNKIDLKNIRLSSEQQRLFELIENSHKNLFITGKAGTGKSVLLQYLKEYSQKNIVVVAPTGIAALNIGGQTIHSFFKIPPEFSDREKLRLNEQTTILLKNIDTLVIDEISMVRADLMDAIDYLLKKARANVKTQFGGAQVVMFGDLYQLPPVVESPELRRYFTHNYGGCYFFNAEVWWQKMPDIYELTEIFRQKDPVFRKILNALREQKVDDSLLSDLNKRVNAKAPVDDIIILAPTNRLVTQINSERLSRIKKPLKKYQAELWGTLSKYSFPTDESLQLKIGAQVMFVKNDKDKRWVNGTIGHVKTLEKDMIKVEVDGKVYEVLPETWNQINYTYNHEERKIEENVVSSFTQYPLRLAWAITIHKSQGKTYSSAIINMEGGAFAHGQTYVALSRCKSLEGLYLKRGISKHDIIVDSAVVDFMKKAKIIDANEI